MSTSKLPLISIIFDFVTVNEGGVFNKSYFWNKTLKIKLDM